MRETIKQLSDSVFEKQGMSKEERRHKELIEAIKSLAPKSGARDVDSRMEYALGRVEDVIHFVLNDRKIEDSIGFRTEVEPGVNPRITIEILFEEEDDDENTI